MAPIEDFSSVIPTSTIMNASGGVRSRQTDHRRTFIGQIVKGIRNDGGGMNHNSRQKLSRKQNQIAYDSCYAGKDPTLRAAPDTLKIITFYKAFD